MPFHTGDEKESSQTGRAEVQLLRGSLSQTPLQQECGHRRITAWWGLEGTSVGHPAQTPAQAGSPRAGCTGPCPGGSGISREKETTFSERPPQETFKITLHLTPSSSVWLDAEQQRTGYAFCLQEN